ncbi:MAG: chemotaxis-specific protein-glutamate methyltransferase CheB [Magnetococcus sp. DMHC-1]|nr:chemotaxis-specific protein-glutamate methyltransferase CheB [Magnetococcales bacterium]
MGASLRIMVVDDTITYRMIMKSVAGSVAGVQVVASTSNGREALDQLALHQPEVILLDVEMPVLDGLETLKYLHKNHPDITVIMVSGLSRSNANLVMECLQAGALDFVTKPLESNATRAREALRRDLEPILTLLLQKKDHPAQSNTPVAPGRPVVNVDVSGPRAPVSTRTAPEPEEQKPAPFPMPRPAPSRSPASPPLPAPSVTLPPKVPPPMPRSVPTPALRSVPSAAPRPGPSPSPVTPTAAATRSMSPHRKVSSQDKAEPMHFDLLLIGSSTGGPAALTQLLSGIGRSLTIPTLIVQHMPPVFTASLAAQLSRTSGMEVQEAQEGLPIGPGRVILAMGGFHMGIKSDAGGMVVSLNEGPRVNECRPAVDVLFQSVAENFTGNVLAVILTGMGRDGAQGVELLKRQKHTWCISQNQESCVVYGMPRAVEESGLADEVLPLDKIGPRISDLCR